MQRLKDILLVGLLLGSALMTGAQSLQKFPAGSKVAFVGNSITEAGYYESYIWLYYMTRFPGERIEVMNVGIGGNTMKDIAARFDEDVVKRNPSAIVLTFGMNDSGYFEYNGAEPQKEADKKVAASRESFLPLVEKLKALPAQKIMMSSSPYDETMKNKDNYFPGKSKAMERIIAFQKEAAVANQWSFVDLFYPMQQINLEGQKSNPEFTIIGKDRIHPGNGGHLVMAYLFLKAQGLAGTPLAEVEVDAKKKVIKKSAGADVSGLTVANGVAFDYLAKALPFPVDSASRMWGSDQKQSDALSVVPFIQDFNQELLRVTGLAAAQYEVKIDGNVMGTWKKEELAAGINLALVVKTPQYKQAVQIANLNQARKEFEGKLRDYYGMEFIFFQPRGMLFQDDQAAYDLASKQAKKDWVVGGKIGAYESLRFPEVRQSYVNQMKFLVDMIYDMNKPKSHRIEVVALGAGKTK